MRSRLSGACILGVQLFTTEATFLTFFSGGTSLILPTILPPPPRPNRHETRRYPPRALMAVVSSDGTGHALSTVRSQLLDSLTQAQQEHVDLVAV